MLLHPKQCVTVPLLAQVLFCYEQFDELTLLHLREFDKKKLISVETDIVVDHYKEEKFEESRPGTVRLPWPLLLHAVLLPRATSEGTPSSPALAAPKQEPSTLPFTWSEAT